ncbi:unnamed protein product [Mytilus coruscus]|uniref:Uncharacterized protein n=1 Tax=Mytilus coruscus TaxID=42192 RepID=A0A6J8EBV4_MYTCO|nr:unnamed protein product [Mytilus coruscus]
MWPASPLVHSLSFFNPYTGLPGSGIHVDNVFLVHVLSFIEFGHLAGSNTASGLLGYIETLQQKCTKKRKRSNALGSTPAPKYQIPDTVRISQGWKHFSYFKQQYTQVRSRKGMALPTADLIMKSNMDYQTCLTTRSIKGRLATMETKLGNNKGEVTSENFSPYQVARIVETESESEEEEEELSSNSPSEFSRHAHQQNQSPQQVTTMFSNLHNTGYISPVAATSGSFVSSPAATSGSFGSLPCATSGTYRCCFVCAQHLFINEKRCPMCRGPIDEVKEIQYG